MQTKAFISAAALLSTVAMAQDYEAYNAAMPTLSSYASVPEWERWSMTLSSSVVASSSTPVAVLASSSVVAAVSSSSTAAVVSTLTTSAPYENPFTIYTTQTDSRGVITGMPSVVTSQPSVVTSQPTQPAPVVVTSSHYANSTTLQTSTKAATTTTGTFAQGTSSAPKSTFTGGAVQDRVTAAGVALIVLGFGFSLL